jgi:hypothetical protein
MVDPNSKFAIRFFLGIVTGGLLGVAVGYCSLFCFMDGLILGGVRVSAEAQITVVALAGVLLGATVAVMRS